MGPRFGAVEELSQAPESSVLVAEVGLLHRIVGLVLVHHTLTLEGEQRLKQKQNREAVNI